MFWLSSSSTLDGGSIVSSERDNCIQAFCKLRRLQEATYNGYCRCISCGALVRWDECDGGHWLSRRYRGTEIEHDNVWPQCRQCNRHGGQEAHNQYSIELEKKIGKNRIAVLEAMKVVYTKRDYREVTGRFLVMGKKIRKEKGL